MLRVWLLTLAQALSSSGIFSVTLLGGILGSRLAPTPGLATLPLTAMIVGLAVSTLPTALAMQRFGRRRVFQGSALLGAAAALLAAHAIAAGQFGSFCAATMMFGLHNAAVMQYRFAATEYVEPERAARAVATVMLGALAAAWLGPEIAVRAADLGGGAHYAGSMRAAALLFLAAALLLSGVAPAGIRAGQATAASRPLRQIVGQPAFFVAVMAGAVSYAVMSFIMTATPISMHVMDHHGEQDTKWVIQSHLLAMYLPSLVSGRVVQHAGVPATMIAGALVMAGCVGVAAFAGRAVGHYWGAMVLLGVGWNFLFVAGTTLLTRVYRPAERFRVQAVNEAAVFGAQAAASSLAGAVLAAAGWEWLNLATVPLLAAMLAGVAWLRRRGGLPAA